MILILCVDTTGCILYPMRIKLLLHVINFYNSIIIILKLIVLNDNYNYVFQLAILDKKCIV